VLTCAVCGGREFVSRDVLWEDLIDKWQLSTYETEYINRQQGQRCVYCGNNLRSIALAKAIVDTYEFNGTLKEFVVSKNASTIRVLEINEAGGLTPILKCLPNHKFIAHPEFDMMNLNLSSHAFDLIIHSDTLEHVKDPVRALCECRRVLDCNGKCIFTIPVIVDRVSRTRIGLPNSYHGSPNNNENSNIVYTEFGMDFWKYVINAGFTKCLMHVLDFPAAVAIEASG